LKNLCEVDLPALGFGIGDVVLGELLKSKGLIPSLTKKLDYFIAISEEIYRVQALGLIHQLRDLGYEVDYSLVPQKLGKQFEAAESRGALKVILVGASIDQGMVSVKTVANREQIEVKLSDLFKKSE